MVLLVSEIMDGIGLVDCWCRIFANLAREIIKDCQDMEADEGIKTTLPMTYGLVKSRMLAYVVVMAALVCLIHTLLARPV